MLLSSCVLTTVGVKANPAFAAANAASGDWPMYLHDIQRTSSVNDTTISTANAAQLVPKWTFKTGGGIAAQAIVVGNTVYIGSWDGYEDVGNPSLVGDQSLNNGIWQLKAAGSDINYFSDQFHYVWQPMTGNVTVSAHVTAQDNTNTGAKAGVILRQSTDPGSIYYGVFVTPGQGIIVQYRTAEGGRTEQITIPGTIPTYLQVSRWNSSFTAYTSNDGVNWTPVQDSTQVLAFPSTLQAGLATTAQNGATLGNVKMDTVSVTPNAAVPPVLCPAGWSCADIANSLPPGSESLNNGTWTIRAGGSDIWSLYDQFHFDWQSLSGDGFISAHMVSLVDTDPWAKAGVMLRQSPDPAAPYYAALITPEHGLAIQYRLTEKGTTNQIAVSGTTPIYLKVARTGGVFSAYTSSDGVNWTLVPNSSIALSLTGSLSAGLAVTSHNTSTRTTAVIDSVNISTTTSCPATWSCADIGNPQIAGAESFTNGTWNIQAGGSDIWGNTDQFHYDWQSLSGDATLNAHVTSITNTDAWAKAGVMLRQSTDPGSPYYGAFVTPGNGVTIQYRSAQGGSTTQLQNIAGQVPVYLQVARSGNSFTTYTSTDGNTWTPIANSTINLGLTGTFLAGLAVTSHNSGLVNTVSMNTVNITTTAPPPPSSGCPNGWNCADIGTPTLVGTQTLNNGVWTLQGGGSDIWNTTDAFHYVWQNLATDGAASAHITAQSNTDPWAKAGVMLRQSTDPGSPYYAVFTTPGNGIAVQSRTTQGGTTTSLTIPGTVPQYLKVARTGTTFTAYTSQNGTTWTPIANSNATITMTGNYLAGLAICSHNDGSLGSATFDTVVIG